MKLREVTKKGKASPQVKIGGTTFKVIGDVIEDMHGDEFRVCCSFSDGRLQLLHADTKIDGVITITCEETGEVLC
jgi:hypothetical protein